MNGHVRIGRVIGDTIIGPGGSIEKVQNITAQRVGQIAGHDITVNNQYLDPQIYLSILEQAIQSDPKFSAVSEGEKDSLLSKIKALKNNPWITSIGSDAIIEFGKKFVGIP
jgi:hypothetical protein